MQSSILNDFNKNIIPSKQKADLLTANHRFIINAPSRNPGNVNPN